MVLAGGFSSRMGQFKPLLQLHGSTLLAHAIATFTGVAEEIHVVVGHRAEDLAEEVRRHGAHLVENPDFAQGMFTSVLAGVRAVAPGVEGCFFLPADIPAVRPHTVAALAAAFQNTRAPVVHPVFRGERGHPPLLSRRLFPEIRAGGEGGLRRILQRHEGEAVDLEVLDEGIHFDLDAPIDYQRAQALPQRRTVPSQAEAVALVDALACPEALRAHAAAVAKVASRLADALRSKGVPLDVELVVTSALLHDVAKGAPDHARAGARLLRRLGYPRVADVIGQHTDLRLDPHRPANEAALVYLADKLVRGDQLVGLEDRFRATLGAHGHTEEARAAISRRIGHALLVAQVVKELTGRDVRELAQGGHPAGGEASA